MGYRVRFKDCTQCGHLTAYKGRVNRTVRERIGLCPDCARIRFKDCERKTDRMMLLTGVLRGRRRCPWSGKMTRVEGQG